MLFERTSRSDAMVADILRKFTNLEATKFDWRTFGLKTQVSRGRRTFGAARDFFSVGPPANSSVEGSNGVVVPFVGSSTEFSGGIATFAVGSNRQPAGQPRPHSNDVTNASCVFSFVDDACTETNDGKTLATCANASGGGRQSR